jgi:hypothetical protein
LGKILGRDGRTVRINQADGFEAALEQVLSGKIKALAKIFATLWQQTEIGRQNIDIIWLGTDRGVNRNRTDDWPAGAWRSEAAATNRNRGTCILQETPIKMRGFLIRERRD